MLAAVAGCATQQHVAPPSTISLEKALTDTVEALAATRKRGLEFGTNFQLYACTVTAAFTISATQTIDNKIAIQACVGPPTIPASAEAELPRDRRRPELLLAAQAQHPGGVADRCG